MNKLVIGIILAVIVLAGLIVGGSYFLFPNQVPSFSSGTGTTTPADTQADTGTPTGTGTGAPTAPAGTGGTQMTGGMQPLSNATGTLDPASVTVATTSPLIEGTAKNTNMVFVSIVDGSTNVWQSQVPVTDGKWMVLGTLPKTATAGKSYALVIRADGQPTGKIIAEGSLVYQP